jgi:hypothetical protein
MKCCSCGADLGFDDDPYADPDCPYCLQRSIEAEVRAEREYEEQNELDEYERNKTPLWASDWHDE